MAGRRRVPRSRGAADLAVRLGARTAASPPSTTRELATAAVVVLGAVVVHGLASLPDGVLGTSGAARGGRLLVRRGRRRRRVARGHVDRTPTPAAVAVGWAVAAASVLPGVYGRYQRATGPSRQRLQWLGTGTVLAVEVALVAGTLNLLVRWPAQVLVVTTLGTVAVAARARRGVVRRAPRPRRPRLRARADGPRLHRRDLGGLPHRRARPRDRGRRRRRTARCSASRSSPRRSSPSATCRSATACCAARRASSTARGRRPTRWCARSARG